jgi:hypothetical protein
LRYCSRCRFDFETVRLAQPRAVTSLTTPSIPAYIASPTTEPPATAAEPNQLLPVFAGIAWLIGAAAIGYLAFLQLEYSGFGLADADEALALALWNGATAAITAYFGAMAILAPTRRRMGGAVLWGIINVAFGAYQVSQGVSHPAFIAALVAFGMGGILALAAWSQLRAADAAGEHV